MHCLSCSRHYSEVLVPIHWIHKPVGLYCSHCPEEDPAAQLFRSCLATSRAPCGERGLSPNSLLSDLILLKRASDRHHSCLACGRKPKQFFLRSCPFIFSFRLPWTGGWTSLLSFHVLAWCLASESTFCHRMWGQDPGSSHGRWEEREARSTQAGEGGNAEANACWAGDEQ